MPLFSIPELREEARNSKNAITVAISRSNLGPTDATHHLNQWAQELIAYARQLNYNVIDISGPDLVYERFTEILQNTKPSILFNFSHGCQSYLVGNDLRCTLARGSEWEQTHPDHFACGICGMPSNLRVVKNMGIVAFSCHSAAQLGKCATKYGALINSDRRTSFETRLYQWRRGYCRAGPLDWQWNKPERIYII
jgi:hypothetical protein